jgi:toxin ParE1/3/4
VRGYRLSKHADEDLRSIFRYTHETWGEEQVWIYLSLLEAARDQLTQNPLCPGSRPREDLAAGCRIFRAGKHYFVYRIQDGFLEIARILHESMDFESQFDGRDFD